MTVLASNAWRAASNACSWSRVAARAPVSTGWNKAGHPLPCGRSSATFLTCVFSSQHFSSYPASFRSDVPSLCPASARTVGSGMFNSCDTAR